MKPNLEAFLMLTPVQPCKLTVLRPCHECLQQVMRTTLWGRHPADRFKHGIQSTYKAHGAGNGRKTVRGAHGSCQLTCGGPESPGTEGACEELKNT